MTHSFFWIIYMRSWVGPKTLVMEAVTDGLSFKTTSFPGGPKNAFSCFSSK